MTFGRLALLCCVLSALQVALTLYATHASPRKYPAEVTARYFDAGYLERVATYREARLRGQRVSIPLEAALPLLFVFAGPLTLLARRLAGAHPVLQGVLIVGAFVLFAGLLSLPLQYACDYLVERRFGFSNQSPLGYLGDAIKGLLVGLVIACAVTAVFLAVHRALPRAWPWVAFVVLSALSVLLTLVFPWVVEPLFYDFRELPQGELRADIEAMLQQNGVRRFCILEMDASRKTNRTNAYVSGLWGSHRVVLFDTLLRRHSHKEVLSVVAHELGHSVKNHVALGLGIGIASIAGGLLLLVLALPRLTGLFPVPLPPGSMGPLLPVLLLCGSLGGFFLGPLGSLLSRTLEAQADRFALETTRDGGAAAAMEKRLTEDNLGDPNPRWLAHVWFASHPDAIARIQMAERFAGR